MYNLFAGGHPDQSRGGLRHHKNASNTQSQGEADKKAEANRQGGDGW